MANATKTTPLRLPSPAVACIELPDGKRVDLPDDGDAVTIGSAGDNAVRVDDAFVSRNHCVIECHAGHIVLRDTGSKNGCFVDGNRVRGATLRSGARLRVGATTLIISSRMGETGGPFDRLHGQTPAFLQAVQLSKRAARSDANVIILGETGTGKELFAAAIHKSSRRAGGPFVALNCGAIPRELVASELFGHEHGAFTGAAAARDGVFVRANKGTLFLDELGELPREQQPHLLRVVENQRVVRVGGGTERTVDTRLISATNRMDIGTSSGSLRTDLYHRLATIVVQLPPLRDRIGDLGLLCHHFLRDLESRYGPCRLSEQALDAMADYHWPGNIRELRQSLHRAAALSDGDLESRYLLPQAITRHGDHTPTLSPTDRAQANVLADAYQCYGSVRGAASALGMPKSTFADRAKRYGVMTHRKK